MSVIKRIALFIAVNFLVVLTLSLFLNLFGIQPYLTSHGVDVRTLAIFCLIWGMGGALVSLFLSKTLAKYTMSIQIIPPESANIQGKRLVEMVLKLSKQAGLPTAPEIGIYKSPEVNAFATGATKRSSLVAVSTGLLDRMDDKELEGVLGHEIAHIANGDMVTMTLLQGILNAFVMFLARMVAFLITKVGSSKDEGVPYGIGYSLVVFFCETVFMFFAMMVIAWFSRRREFRADVGGALYAGRDKMVLALRKLQQVIQIQDPKDASSQASFQAFKISTPKSWVGLFSTHPPLEERIQNLLEISVR